MNSQSNCPLVFTIILNWNGKNDTLECLESMNAVDYSNLKIIVADNGSNDGSVDAIRHNFPHVIIIKNGENLGFAEGNNRAINYALESGADFIFILNNDTIVDPKIVSALVMASKDNPKSGIFGTKIYYHAEPKRIWYAGGYWDKRTLRFEEVGKGEMDQGQYELITETEWVIGCAMFIRAEVFRKIGLFESKFFLNNEEIDLCSRAKNSGFTCIYVPDARLWHKISVSFGGEYSPLKEYFGARNRLLWARRNAHALLRVQIHLNTLRILGRKFLRPISMALSWSAITPKERWWYVIRSFKNPISRAYFYGVRDYWHGRFGDCPLTVKELARVCFNQSREKAL